MNWQLLQFPQAELSRVYEKTLFQWLGINNLFVGANVCLPWDLSHIIEATGTVVTLLLLLTGHTHILTDSVGPGL